MLSAILADETNFYWTYDQATDLWHQLELASWLESELGDYLPWSYFLQLSK